MDKGLKKPAETLFGVSASGRELSMTMGEYVADCYSGESPPCRMACPLDFDVSGFIARVQRDNFKSAYKVFCDHAIFPQIVSTICEQPCANVCARKSVDSAIDLKKLERAAVDLAGPTAPAKYNMPKRDETVAIVGAGLCGLSCTARLASHGYNVVVFEKTSRKGGILWELLPDGKFVEEIELQMRYLDYEFRPETPISNLDELRGFDSVLLACGSGGCDFGLLDGLNRDSLGSVADGIFLGGGLIGSSPVESIENGIRASQSIESYMKIGRMHEMTAVSTKKSSRLKVNQKLFTPSDRPTANIYTKEQAMQEAACCPRCDCSDCIRSCDFMQAYNKLPKKIVNDAKMKLNPVEGLQGSKGTRMINSCSACGLCAELCSERIDMGEFLLGIRSIMHREGALPPVFHDFWIRDMQHSQGEKAYLAKRAPGNNNCDYLFFPGCQLGASDPACVGKTYEYLLEKLPATGLLLSCCGAPAKWAGDDRLMEETAGGIGNIWEDMGKPEIIFACPSCEKTLGEYLPEIKLISIFEVILRHGLPERPFAGGGTVSVFDPCSGRHNPGMQKSVRELVSMTGRTIEELPVGGKEAVCCGFGGHISPANTELAKKIVTNRINLGSHPFVAYCVNCRDLFSMSGKKCVHILDLVFGSGNETHPVPSLSKKRENREILKRDLLRQVWGQDTEMEEKDYEIVLEPRLREKLDKLLILEDDIYETISHCEKTHLKILDPETGCYIGHCKRGVVTYWAEYRIENRQYIVSNVYSHRMRIEGE